MGFIASYGASIHDSQPHFLVQDDQTSGIRTQ